MVGKTRNIEPATSSMLSWVVPLLVGAAVAAVLGVVIHQVFLRWNQGQDLRQALITVAISVILADQMLAHFGGLAQRMVWPGDVTHFFEIFGQRYATSRLFMLGVALRRRGAAVAVAEPDADGHRHPGRRRRPVDGAGARHQHRRVVFAVTFFVGAFLAGMGGAMGASFAGVAPGADGQWLLNSLVVVIIGGLGSIKGAVAGSLLYGMVAAFSPAYLPTDYTFYSIIFTFVLLALVLAVRPNGLFGQAGMSAVRRDRVARRHGRHGRGRSPC